jgi:hypothetical protein
MLQVTYLGWQGWLVRSARSSVLVDPLLADDVGRGPPAARAGWFLWPPRSFDWDRFPAVDAVVVTHEHEDHFNLASLAMVDRRVPIHLSTRSSAAARTVLGEMGFEVRPADPGRPLALGDQLWELLSPDLVADPEPADEWDTLAFLVRPEGGSAAFFSNVDIEITPAMTARLATAGGPGRRELLIARQMALYLGSASLESAEARGQMHRPSPSSTFAVTPATALSLLQRGTGLQPLAGQTVVLGGPQAVEVAMDTPFLRTLPRSGWPPRPRYWPEPDAPLDGPSLGLTFSERMLPEIENGLRGIAEYLYGRELFRALYSLDAARDRRPTFAWMLAGASLDEIYGYEYVPQRCDFQPIVSRDGAEATAGMVVSWASDLWGLMQGLCEPRMIVRSVRETWSAELAGTWFFKQVLWPYFHPLRHPAACLEGYRRAARSAAPATRVCAPRSDGPRLVALE